VSGSVSKWADEPTCLACPASRPVSAWRHGWRGPWCRNCAERWLYAGRPASGPPPSRQQVGGRRDGRLEDYAELRSWGETLECAAIRLGVCRRTAERYEAALRAVDTEGLAA